MHRLPVARRRLEGTVVASSPSPASCSAIHATRGSLAICIVTKTITPLTEHEGRNTARELYSASNSSMLRGTLLLLDLGTQPNKQQTHAPAHKRRCSRAFRSPPRPRAGVPERHHSCPRSHLCPPLMAHPSPRHATLHVAPRCGDKAAASGCSHTWLETCTGKGT